MVANLSIQSGCSDGKWSHADAFQAEHAALPEPPFRDCNHQGPNKRRKVKEARIWKEAQFVLAGNPDRPEREQADGCQEPETMRHNFKVMPLPEGAVDQVSAAQASQRRTGINRHNDLVFQFNHDWVEPNA